MSLRRYDVRFGTVAIGNVWGLAYHLEEHDISSQGVTNSQKFFFRLHKCELRP